MSEGGILIVEDDPAIGAGLARVLSAQGYRTEWVGCGADALRAMSDDVGLVILDLGLPDMDGMEVCTTLRAGGTAAAIMILTARDDEIDVVAGLDAGADDYLVKPFRLSELLARVRAHLRRSSTVRADAGTLEAAGIVLDRAARRAWRDGAELALRPREFDLLALVMSEAGRVVTRERLMAEVWDTQWMGSTKTLDMHVHALRQKIGAERISTLRGVGYRFETG